MVKQQWIFKAYSGIHLGAEVALGAGEYSVGSGYGCDVIIDDSSLSAKHFLLKVSEDGFEWKAFKDQTNVNVKDAAGNKDQEKDNQGNVDGSMTRLGEIGNEGGAWRKIAPYEVVSVGAFRFAYGIVGGAWPPLRSDDRRLSEDDTNISVDVPHDQSVDSEVKIHHGEDVFGIDSDTDASRVGGGGGRSFVSWALSLIIVVSVVFWVLDGENEERASTLTPTEQALMIVQEKRLTGIRVTARPDLSSGGPEMLKISGFVDRVEEKSQLTEALRQANIKAEIDVVAMEYLKSAVEILAERYKFPDLKIEKGNDPGTLVAKGYVPDVGQWKAFKERVEMDVPGLAQFVDNVDTQDMRFAQLKRMIRQHGLEGQIDVWQGKGEFVVSPSINPDMRREWERLMQTYYRRFGDQPPIRQEVVIVEGFDVRSVSLGNPPFVVMSNGQKFTEGARLQNGYLIHRIDKNEVVLRRDGKYVVYPIEGSSKALSPSPDNKEKGVLPETNESKKDVTESYFIS